MILPDYGGGSIVNLMRSLGDACGAPALPYAPLRDFDVSRLARSRTIVLLVIDGLGYRYLTCAGAHSALRDHLWSRLTSVFPSTTASAVTAFMTGVAPQQHGLCGWHMYLGETDSVMAILPLTPRSGPPVEDAETLARRLFTTPSFFDLIGRRACAVSPKAIWNSPFNARHCGRATRMPYANLPEMFDILAQTALAGDEPTFVYAYFPELDATAHRLGISSRAAAQVFEAFDAGFRAFLERIGGTDTMVLVTADHGFIDAPPARLIELDHHPQFASLLQRPLCGERRVAYCYVEPHKRTRFEEYVRDGFAACLDVHHSRSLLDAGWFGHGTPHPRLAERIGDYTLVMKNDWTIKDWLPDEKRHSHLGVHGGVSDDEMFVPLIMAYA